MTTYALEYADGRVSEIVAECDADAVSAALARLEDGCVAADHDQWDADGTNDDGQLCERLLIWESEADSINDAGANAVAQLTVVR